MRAPLLPRAAGPTLDPLPPEAAAVVRSALARRPHGHAVIVFADGEVRVDDRELLIAAYRRAGVRELVSALRSASVPATHEVALVDLEAATRVIAVDREALLAMAPPSRDVARCEAFASGTAYASGAREVQR